MALISNDLRDLWRSAGAEIFPDIAERVGFRRGAARAVVDDLPYATVMRPEGGGLMEEFSGSVVFLKADFPRGDYPKEGEIVTVGARRLRLAKTEGQRDRLDPFITVPYQPAAK